MRTHKFIFMCCAALICGCSKHIHSDNAGAHFFISTTGADGKTVEISAAAVIRSVTEHGAPRRDSLLLNLQPPDDPVRGKDISWLGTFESEGRDYWVMIFNPCSQSWPGSQPISIVVADSELAVQTWSEAGGSPLFRQATLRQGRNEAELTVLSRNRGGGTWIGVFSLSPTNIAQLSPAVDERLRTGLW